jgi:PKD repeat protein
VAPLEVHFSSDGSRDPDPNDSITFEWDFDGNGTVDSRLANPVHTYTQRGIFEATLRVTDATGRSASSSVRIVIGNQAPQVNLTVWVCPATGACTPRPSPALPFQFGSTVHFEVEVIDDQPVDCDRVNVAYILGHDQHGHPQSSTTGCSGTIQVPPADAGHAGENISAVFVASYTDQPAGETPQSGSDEVILRPNP